MRSGVLQEEINKRAGQLPVNTRGVEEKGCAHILEGNKKGDGRK